MPGKPFAEWPRWYHGPDGQSEIFNSLAEVPYGWVKNKPPEFVPTPPPEAIDRDTIIARLTELGVEINPIWGDAHLKKVLDDRSPPR